MRKITEEQAWKVLDILGEECGHVVHHQSDAEAFVYRVTKTDCREYRFGGALGSGGKFRNNGNHENTPHVSCYPEHETTERLAMIAKANARLAELFGPEEGEKR